MLENTELKALPPARPKRSESYVIPVNSGNILLYLFAPHLFKGRPLRFAEHLDLAIFSPILERLEETKKEDYIFDEETRKESDFLFKGNSNSFDHTDEMESATAIYFNSQNGEIENTPIEHGSHAHSIIKLNTMSQDAVPLAAIHTHPGSPSLFSPIDYSMLLVGGDSWRLCSANGLVERRAGVQFFALATPQTPYFESLEQAQLYIRDFESPYLEKLGAFNESITQAQNVTLTTLRGLQEISGKETVDSLYSGNLDELRLISDAINEVGFRAAGLAARRYSKYLNRSTNEMCIKFARMINVVLYASQDRRNFYKIDI